MTERQRVKEHDFYEEVMAYTREVRQRSIDGRVVVRAGDLPWLQERQAFVKYYLWPSRYSGRPPETVLDEWAVFAQRIGTHSGKHRHQGGLAIFALEGEGYSVVDGVRYEWEAGDLLLLPLKPGGVEHQHFNRQEGKPAKWVAFIHAALYEWGASELVQLQEHPDFPRAGSRHPAPGEPGHALDLIRPQPQATLPPAPQAENLLEWLYARRDAQRAAADQAPCVVRGRELPWEQNRQGKMRWYLHPAMHDTAIRSLTVFVQEIPPGSRTGLQRVPGGSVLFMLRGRGYTLLDGERHDWQADDCLNLPIRRDGVSVQHVNPDPTQTAAFVSVDLNLVDVLGVNRGAAFEQLESAPDQV